MYQTKEMFDVKLMDQFRTVNNPSEELRDAWYNFVYKLLPIVNETWCKLMKEKNLTQKTDLYEHISMSDEALVRWVILCKIDKIVSQDDSGQAYEINKGKKSGPHDSLAKKHLYVAEYSKILKSYGNDAKSVRNGWNDLFWERMQSKHTGLFNDRHRKRARIEQDDTCNFPDEDPDWA
jgi:hypothetical protein